MRIEKIKLFNYRNFEEEEIFLNPEVNVIRGKNAQGKTNFLEAIYLFSKGKSYRPAGDKELIRFGSDYFSLDMDFISEDFHYHAFMKVNKEGKKEISFNSIPLKKNSLLSEYFKTVLFCPEEIEIIKGEKELRRNFLDDSISVLRPNYVKILRDYNKCLKQKNTLLKKGGIKEISSMLDIWNQRLTEYGARLFMYRGSFISLLEKYSCEKMEELTGGKEKLKIKYVPSVPLRDIKDVEKIKNDFKEKTERLKNAEIEKCQALTGPHRDDVEFLINGKNVKLYGSQGQQRSLILCLKLAMTEIIKDRTGTFPVLLLDDIMSELDKKRQSYLTEKIKGKQTVITCTGTSGLRKSKRVSFFTAEKGKIKREE